MQLLILCAPGVQQVFALEINSRPAQFPCEPLGKVKGRGPPAKLLQVIVQLTLERGVLSGAEVLLLQFLQRMHQRLGHITSAVGSKMALGIRRLLRLGGWQAHAANHSLCRDLRRGRPGPGHPNPAGRVAPRAPPARGMGVSYPPRLQTESVAKSAGLSRRTTMNQD